MNSLARYGVLLAEAAILLLLGFSVCVKKATGQQVRPPDAQVLAGLRFEAHKHGLRFKVFCIPNDEGGVDHYQADAEQANTPEGSLYYEEGARDWYAETGDSAIEAAYALYLALANNRPPSMRVDHRPKIGRCNYNEIYSSNHETAKNPCSR